MDILFQHTIPFIYNLPTRVEDMYTHVGILLTVPFTCTGSINLSDTRFYGHFYHVFGLTFIFQDNVIIKNVHFYTLILNRKLKTVPGMTEDSVDMVSIIILF
jgi:hypothetical protein